LNKFRISFSSFIHARIIYTPPLKPPRVTDLTVLIVTASRSFDRPSTLLNGREKELKVRLITLRLLLTVFYNYEALTKSVAEMELYTVRLMTSLPRLYPLWRLHKEIGPTMKLKKPRLPRG